ncbi:TerC family protein [Luteolibacter flavescens]|uniref:TerC family protein n=1 Tax=Luteolibacter flavescens TaxID=1859460 RepID=A0ABT3FR94_9BACT|nr:TerC family protein [Luteolibacter flavescens]MCW1886104.1 TerC family protein [Luteolibacter flavescens]
MIASLLEFHWLNDPQAWGALLTLTLLEIVLGIDNIVFISILVDRLPEEKRKSGRLIGLSLAMGARLVLLLSITWIMSLQNPLFHVPIHPMLWDMIPKAGEHGGHLGISWKDMILLLGGFFLIYKSTKEIHHKFDGIEESHGKPKAASSFGAVLVQIAMIDIIFSLDSVITAVGMVNDPTRVSLMMVAVVISIAVMMLASGAVSDFVSKHPSVKMLALSFLILIGTALMAEGMHFHIPKGYIYFAMAFSLGVELLNLKLRSKGTIVQKIVDQ